MAAATLVDELIEEILIRIPPEEPAHLVFAALVCKAWHRILSDNGFLRRYRRFHGTPPLLGYIQNLYDHACIFPTLTASRVSAAALTMKKTLDSSYSVALDCRHRRVLIHFTANPKQLIVWDPNTGVQQHLSLPPSFPVQSYTGSVLCATKSCDHLDCGGGPFLVVFVWTCWMDNAVDGMIIQASTYSSETGAWSTPTSIDIKSYIHTMPGLLLGDVLYFTTTIRVVLRILKYDLLKHGLSVMDVPRQCGIPLVMKGDDGGLLQLATLSHNSIYMWSQQYDPTNTSHGWVKNKVMDLHQAQLVPEHGPQTRARKVIGFAEGTDIIFISTDAGIVSLDLKSRQVRKVCERTSYTMFPILPYMSFCTPR